MLIAQIARQFTLQSFFKPFSRSPVAWWLLPASTSPQLARLARVEAQNNTVEHNNCVTIFFLLSFS
jgi:hypothetical protein